MISLALHRDLYAKSAIDEALTTFGPYATLAVEEQGDVLCVRIEASSPARERRVAGEFGNFALGATVRDRGTR